LGYTGDQNLTDQNLTENYKFYLGYTGDGTLFFTNEPSVSDL